MVKSFLKDAKDNLILAKEQLKYVPWDIKGGFYDAACFWAHQVAEKAVKAYMFYLGIPLLKKHKIARELLPMIKKVDQEAERIIKAGSFLDQFFLPVRYGGPARPAGGYSKAEAELAYKYAQEILEFIKKKIKKI